MRAGSATCASGACVREGSACLARSAVPCCRLWSWIDTAADNYPCVPPNFDKCLDPRLVMPLFGFVDHLTKGVRDTTVLSL